LKNKFELQEKGNESIFTVVNLNIGVLLLVKILKLFDGPVL